MAHENTNPIPENSRRDFLKNSALVATGLSLGVSNYAYAETNSSKTSIENEEKTIKNKLRVASVLNDKTRNKYRDNLKRMAWLNLMSADFTSPTNLEINAFTTESKKIIEMNDVELAKNYGEMARGVKLFINAGAITSPLNPVLGPLGIYVGTAFSGAGLVLDDSIDQNISESQFHIGVHQKIHQQLDKFPELKKAVKASQIDTNSLGVELEKEPDEILESFGDASLNQNFKDAIAGNREAIKSYIDAKSQEIIKDTAEAVNQVLKEREAAAKEQKKKELYDKQEKEGQVYLTKFLIGNFIKDKKTAKAINTGIDAALNIAGLVASNAGPWAMTAGFVGGFQSLQAAFGNGGDQPHPAIMQALSEIKSMLENIDQKLDVVLENQTKILGRLNDIAEEILYTQNANHIQIREDLKGIAQSVLGNREFIRSSQQLKARDSYDSAIQLVKAEAMTDTPDVDAIEMKVLNSLVNYATLEANNPYFNGYISGGWNAKTIRDELLQSNSLDLHINKIPVFINKVSGNNIAVGPNKNEATNPLEWSRATLAFTQTLLAFPELAKRRTTETQLRILKTAGQKIKKGVDEILLPENVDDAFNIYSQTVEYLIDNGIENAKKEIQPKNGITAEGLKKIHINSECLFPDDYDEISITGVGRISDDLVATSENKNNELEKIQGSEDSYHIKTSSNLFSEIGNYTYIGDFFTTREENPINMAQKVGLINLIPLKEPGIPISLDLPGKKMKRDKGIRGVPAVNHLGKDKSPSETIIPFTSGYYSEEVTRYVGSRRDGEEHTLYYNWKYDHIKSTTKFEYSAYKIQFNSGSLKDFPPLGTDKHGWTIAKLTDLASMKEVDGVSFWSDFTKNQIVDSKPLNTTKDVLNVVRDELSKFHEKNKSELTTSMAKKITDSGNIIGDEYEAVALSLQALGALQYWNNGNSLHESTAIAKDYGYLFSLLEPEKTNFRDTVKDVYLRALETEPKVSDAILTEHIKEEMLTIIENNLKKFRETLFVQNTSDVKGIPEVEFALEMIKQVEKQYKIS